MAAEASLLNLAYMAEFALVFNIAYKELSVKPILKSLDEAKQRFSDILSPNTDIEASREEIDARGGDVITDVFDELDNFLHLKSDVSDIKEHQQEYKTLKSIQDGWFSESVGGYISLTVIVLMFITIDARFDLELVNEYHEYIWWVLFALLSGAIFSPIGYYNSVKDVDPNLFEEGGYITIKLNKFEKSYAAIMKDSNNTPSFDEQK